MSGQTIRFVKSCVRSRAARAMLALAAFACVPAATFAGDSDRGERYERKRDADDSRRGREREHENWRDDDRRGGSGFRVDVDIRTGSWERVPPPPTRVYEERVWVEPVYRTVCDRVWVPATYRTVVDCVWVEPVVECVTDQVWVPDRYETRHIVCYERGRRIVRCERVLVERGHYETRTREVVVSTGHYEDRTREELVCAAHWQNVERRELVTPGHWETRHVAAAPRYEPSHGSRIALRW